MNKKEQLLAIQQFAMIWNYNAHVEHQHNYYCGKPNKKDIDGVKFDEGLDNPKIRR